MKLAAYLDWENAQEEKHEFVQGEIYAMTGGRRAHGRVVSNLNRRVGEALDATACQVFVEGMKVQVAEDTVLYPDVFVTCDAADLATEQIFRNPKLIIEVLSPSTQAYDRSKKFALYRRIPALLEYVLVDPETRRIEAFRRNAAGEWVLHDMSDGPALVLPCIDASVPMAEVFEGVDPPAAEAAQVTA
jgi:Uma2 family endonuclease